MTEAGFHRSMIIHRDRFLEIIRQPPERLHLFLATVLRMEINFVKDGKMRNPR